MTRFIKKEYEINDILITEYTDEQKKHHVDAYKDNCTGHGNTAFNAILDWEIKQQKSIKLIKST